MFLYFLVYFFCFIAAHFFSKIYALLKRNKHQFSTYISTVRVKNFGLHTLKRTLHFGNIFQSLLVPIER